MEKLTLAWTNIWQHTTYSVALVLAARLLAHCAPLKRPLAFQRNLAPSFTQRKVVKPALVEAAPWVTPRHSAAAALWRLGRAAPAACRSSPQQRCRDLCFKKSCSAVQAAAA